MIHDKVVGDASSQSRLMSAVSLSYAAQKMKFSIKDFLSKEPKLTSNVKEK